VGIPADRVAPIDNGTVVEIDSEGIRRLPVRAAAGYVYVDGLSIEEADDVVFRDRAQLAQDGLIIVMLTVERSTGKVVGGPELVTRGFIEGTDSLLDEAREHTLSVVSGLAPDTDWTVWQSAVHEGLSRFLFKRTRTRPLILPVVTEI